MLKILNSVEEYMDFIREVNADPIFRDPMLCTEEQIQCNLLKAQNNPANQILGIFDKDKIIGLFVFLVLKEEAYLEMLVGLSKSREAYAEMIAYFRREYKGWQADFVYNPDNFLLREELQKAGAAFDVEQQKMVLKKEVSYNSRHQIELYQPKYREQYCTIHSQDGYWTADKVIDALDRFRIILAIENEEVVGYIDITYQFEENEPFDVFVREEYRKQGYAKAMLAKAIAQNKPNGMMLLVDVDNTAAIALYESMGFVKSVGENSIAAHVMLE